MQNTDIISYFTEKKSSYWSISSMLSFGKKWESKNQEHGNLWVIGFFEGFLAPKRLKIGFFSS